MTHHVEAVRRGQDSIKVKSGVKMQLKLEQALDGHIYSLSKGRVFTIFLSEIIQSTRNGRVRIRVAGGNEIIDVEQIVPGQESVACHLAGIKRLAGGVVKITHSLAAQVIADHYAPILAPGNERRQAKDLFQCSRIETDRAGGVANVALKALVTDVRYQQAISGRIGGGGIPGHSRRMAPVRSV